LTKFIFASDIATPFNFQESFVFVEVVTAKSRTRRPKDEPEGQNMKKINDMHQP
jgi:hypothetical protein